MQKKSNTFGDKTLRSAKKSENHTFFNQQTLYIYTGYLMCFFGIIGIFIPLLPVTPFLLAATLLFAKSSPKMYNRLHSNEYLGSFIKNHQEHCGLPYKTIRRALLVMWLILTIYIFFIHSKYFKLVLFAVGTGLSIHLLMLHKSYRKHMENPPAKE